MLPWYLHDFGRVQLERDAIETLVASQPWLTGYKWRFVDGDLCLDAIVRAHGYDYNLRVILPPFFPESPAVVKPLGETSRLSSHQYGGAEGALCLQWGPDNWHPSVTAARMLTSAFELLNTENPRGQGNEGGAGVVQSRHALTAGQELRREWLRWYSSPQLRAYLATLPQGSAGTVKFSWRIREEDHLILVHQVHLGPGEPWTDVAVPENLPEATPRARYTGVVVNADPEIRSLRGVRTIEELKVLVAENGMERTSPDGSLAIQELGQGISAVLIRAFPDGPELFLVTDGKAYRCTPVQSESASPARAPAEAALREKKVAVVGLGSAGSKVAVTLARMGVRRFLLVDHDLMLPENLSRNALNWDAVLRHKVSATAHEVKLIRTDAEVDASILHLTGQESNAAVNAVLDKLSQCDFIVDATANPRAFNLLAGVAHQAAKPFVWFEVFGGGVGGLVARSRPDKDPSAQNMRAGYLSYCAENPAPPELIVGVDYEIEAIPDEPMIATDADVSVIAHHAARFVTDALTSLDSIFPHSMYLIGLAKAWVFEAPFATIPLALPTESGSSGATSAPELDDDTAAFLTTLISEASS
jgi:hypothetical protein